LRLHGVLEFLSAPPLAEAVLDDCLLAFPHARLAVTGGCMAPALVEGDAVLLLPPERRRPRTGDVVLVRLSEGLRLHRLVIGPPFSPLRWRTQADRGFMLDPRLDARAVLGTVVGVERVAGGGSRSARSVSLAIRSLLRSVRTRVAGLGA
jgi:hypothetical protein